MKIKNGTIVRPSMTRGYGTTAPSLPAWLTLFALIGLTPATTFAEAGAFQFVTGEVRIQSSSGQERNAKKGDLIEEGDQVITGRPALAQLRMIDGGVLVVRADTHLSVRSYRFSGTADGSEAARYFLHKGSVRAITGVIGKVNKKAYLIQTPTANIGVRGTDHEPYVIPKPAPGETTVGKPGTYDKVNVGETYIETKKGLVVIKPNMVGYAEDENAVPTILPSIPDIYNSVISRGSSGDSGDAKQRLLSASGANLGAAGSSAFANDVRANTGAVLAGDRQLTMENLDASGRPSENQDRATLAAYAREEKSSFTQAISARDVVFGRGGAVLQDSGSDSDLRANWGRWTGPVTVGAGPTVGGFTFVNSDNLTPDSSFATLTFVAAYSYFGGPRPTDANGNLGQIDRLNATIDFGRQRVTDYSVALRFGENQNWSAQGTGTLGQFLKSENGIHLDGLCTGCVRDITGASLQSSAGGTAHGAILSHDAQGMATVFGLQSGGATATGGALLKK